MEKKLRVPMKYSFTVTAVIIQIIILNAVFMYMG